MLFKLTNISVILFFTTFVNCFSALISWQRRKSRGGLLFALGMAAVTFWTLASGFDYAAVPVSLKVFFAQWEYVGSQSALAFFAMFTLSYAGRQDWLRKTAVRLFFLFVPLSNILLAWTNGLHRLLWSGFLPDPSGNNAMVYVHGPAFDWVTLSGYLMTGIIAVDLLQVAFSRSALQRRQARLLLLALLVPLAGGTLYQFDVFHLPGVDWSSITFSIAGILFVMALYGSRLLTILPIARDTVIEQLPDGVLVLDKQYHLIDLNPAAETILGIGQEQLWMPAREALSGWPWIVTALLNPPVGTEQEVSHATTGATYSLRVTPLEDGRGQSFGQLVVIRDVSEIRRVEAARQESEANFREVFDNTAHGIFIVEVTEDGRFRIGDSNRAEEVATTVRREDLLGKLLEEAFPAEIAAALQVNYSRCVAADAPITYEEDVNLSGVGHRYYLTTLAPVHDQAGRICRIIGSTLEISDRKRMEDELRLSEEKFYKAFQSSPDAITITRLEDGRILDVNDGFCRLLGYTRAEALADSTIHLGLWVDPHDREEVVAQLRQTGHVREREIQCRSKLGELVIGIYSGEIVQLENQPHILSTIYDITQRKLAENQLLAAQAQILEQQREIARVEERRRMARDLHNSVSQSIHSLVLFTETLAATLEKNNLERARQIGQRIQESALQAHKETRLLLYELEDSDRLQIKDLKQALENRLTRVERHAGIKASILEEGAPQTCPPEWAENLYWIAMEALNNSLKHCPSSQRIDQIA